MMKHQKLPLVSVIIVNWNGLSWLKGCLPTLAKITYENTEWIIVDNASTDGSVGWIRKNYPRTTIVINTKNLGFSHANNLGFEKAHGQYVLFLNNDTLVDPNFLTELIDRVDLDQNIAGAQSKILLMDDRTHLDAVGAFPTWTGFLYHNGFRQPDSAEFDKCTELYTAKGACMLFRTSVLRKVEVRGWIFDPDYFAYFEETDLCHRIWLSGYSIVYAPKSVIYHKMGATSSHINNAFVQYHSFKNRIHSYLKNLGPMYLCIILPLHVSLCILLVPYAFVTGKKHLSVAVLRAVGWNLRKIPQTFRDRMFVQKEIRKRSDAAWLPRLMRFPPLSYYFGILG